MLNRYLLGEWMQIETFGHRKLQPKGMRFGEEVRGRHKDGLVFKGYHQFPGSHSLKFEFSLPFSKKFPKVILNLVYVCSQPLS